MSVTEWKVCCSLVFPWPWSQNKSSLPERNSYKVQFHGPLQARLLQLTVVWVSAITSRITFRFCGADAGQGCALAGRPRSTTAVASAAVDNHAHFDPKKCGFTLKSHVERCSAMRKIPSHSSRLSLAVRVL